ncbi:hypothetical protein C8F04DRAFT_1064424 [Mycena alexandri]|uniref:Uncharacterized protein n=1 Tax=Mycena alexandri TaxID=1745969 RepID=A0AAD6XFT9_9AGAR|nr:hypothetical protein C8F04DRAFT_1064424 [Mycena alexandri]
MVWISKSHIRPSVHATLSLTSAFVSAIMSMRRGSTCETMGSGPSRIEPKVITAVPVDGFDVRLDGGNNGGGNRAMTAPARSEMHPWKRFHSFHMTADCQWS